MTKDDDKVLPKDFDSDFSLPGRFEEGSSEAFDPPVVKPKPNSKIILIVVFAFIIISAGSFSYYFLNQEEIDSQIIQNRINGPENKLLFQYGVGEYGSDHAHAAITVFINDEQLNFGLPQFQGTSKYIHFENNNPYQIHMHATGVPLEILFSSFGMKLTLDCIEIDSKDSAELDTNRFCEEEDKPLLYYLNGERYYTDISKYVIKHGDRILISVSDEKSIPKQQEFLDSLEIFDVPRKTPQYSGENITF